MNFARCCWIAVICFLTSIAYGTTPQVSNVSPVSGSADTQVQITGSNFGATQGTSTVTFGGRTATIVTWSDTQITAKVPSLAISGAVVVRVGGVSSSGTLFFNVPTPQITSISPTSGAIGTQVTITGMGFQAAKGTNGLVSFNGTTVTNVISWSDTQIVAAVPTNARTGAIAVVANNSLSSNTDQVFTLPNPLISAITPSSGPLGTAVQISGSGFGASQGSSTIQFSGAQSSVTVTSWSDTSIAAVVPATAISGKVTVTVGGVVTNSNVAFTVPPPQINSVSPVTGVVGTQVTVVGSGFQSSKGNSTITFNGIGASVINSWTDTQIVATVPTGVVTGPVAVNVNSTPSNQDVLFTVVNPVITSLSPTSGPAGTQFQVNGTGFGATQGTSTLTFGSVISAVGWSDTQIVAVVPANALTSTVSVVVGNVRSTNNPTFTVPPPHVASVSPSSGNTGTQVTVTGTGFGSTQNTLKFNGNTASVTSWSDTQIVATVPAAATTGPVTVSISNVTSNADVLFTMPNPSISSISPSSGPVGTQVQINGSGFGATQGSSIVKFNPSTQAAIVSWSDSQILATVPGTATTGAVTVVSGGVTSNNNIDFTVPPPQITSITPSSGVIGTEVTVTGSGFQATQGTNRLLLNTGKILTITSWSDTQIKGTIPTGAVTAPLYVQINGISSNMDFVFTLPNPVMSAISPQGGAINTQVQITGSGFGSTQGASTLKLGSVNMPIVNWSDGSITATIPTGAVSGFLTVTVGGVPSSLSFSVSNVFVNDFSPRGGPAGTSVQVTGSGFGNPGTIKLGNLTIASPTWTDTQIGFTVPMGATSGRITVMNSGGSSTSSLFQCRIRGSKQRQPRQRRARYSSSNQRHRLWFNPRYGFVSRSQWNCKQLVRHCDYRYGAKWSAKRWSDCDRWRDCQQFHGAVYRPPSCHYRNHAIKRLAEYPGANQRQRFWPSWGRWSGFFLWSDWNNCYLDRHLDHTRCAQWSLQRTSVSNGQWHQE